MKKASTLLLLFCFISLLPGLAQAYKFGNVPRSDLEMTVYESDPSAPAVVLYEGTDVYYTISSTDGKIERVTDYCVRIKVLTPEGTSYGDVEIPYYEYGHTRENVPQFIGIVL